MNDRVRRQEIARGWHRRLTDHRLSEAQVEVVKKLIGAREWEHDRRLRGQYE